MKISNLDLTKFECEIHQTIQIQLNKCLCKYTVIRDWQDEFQITDVELNSSTENEILENFFSNNVGFQDPKYQDLNLFLWNMQVHKEYSCIIEYENAWREITTHNVKIELLNNSIYVGGEL